MKIKNINKIFKYINPFYWINKRKNREIYFIILASKYYYIAKTNNNCNIEMCYALTHMFNKIGYDIDALRLEYIIPKFNRKFLNAKYYNGGLWWDYADHRSRLTAFEKLLEYYKDKI